MLPLTLTLGTLLLGSPSSPGRSAPVAAQGQRWQARQTWPLIASGHLSSLGFFPTGRHGGAIVGTELVHVRRRAFRLVQPLTLGYAVQRPILQGPTLDAGLAARWLAPFGLFGDIGLSVGVQHVIAATRTYAARGDRFGASTDPGRGHARIGLCLQLGYELASTTAVPLRVVVGWTQRVLTPFAPRNDLPVMPQATFLFGLAVHLRKANL